MMVGDAMCNVQWGTWSLRRSLAFDIDDAMPRNVNVNVNMNSGKWADLAHVELPPSANRHGQVKAPVY